MWIVSTQLRRTVGQSIPPGLEPTTAAFVQCVAALGGPPIEELPVAEARRNASALQAGNVSKLAVTIELFLTVRPEKPGSGIGIVIFGRPGHIRAENKIETIRKPRYRS
jgi:hypothetical protein